MAKWVNGGAMTRHLRVWNNFWIPFCTRTGTDPWLRNTVAAANFLHEEQAAAEVKARARGARVQHSRYKECRAALGVIWSIANGFSKLADDWFVASTAAGLRKTAPNRARYDDTWDPSLIMIYIYYMAQNDVFIKDMPLGEMRPWVVALLRLSTMARSADIAPNKHDNGGVYINYINDGHGEDVRTGLMGNATAGTITQVRFFANKTVAGRPDEYSSWHELDYLAPNEKFPLLYACCARTVLEKYTQRRRSVSTNGDALFISARKRADRYTCVGADTVRNDMGWVMTRCGIPERFKPHSVRHAALSKGERDAKANGHNVDDVCRSADVSKEVCKMFYSRPCCDVTAAEQLEVGLKAMQGRIIGSRGSKRRASAMDQLPARHAPSQAVWQDPAQPLLPASASASQDRDHQHDPSVQPGDAFEIDYIVGYTLSESLSTKSGKYLTFKIRWSGFGQEADSDEPFESLNWGSKFMLDQFLLDNPRAAKVARTDYKWRPAPTPRRSPSRSPRRLLPPARSSPRLVAASTSTSTRTRSGSTVVPEQVD